MILVDASVWIDHFRSEEPVLSALLIGRRVLGHPFVLGEVALGRLPDRDRYLQTLHDLPQAEVANNDEVMRLIELQPLFGRGIGYVDAHLLAAVRLTLETTLWTRDQRLRKVADEMGLAQPFIR